MFEQKLSRQLGERFDGWRCLLIAGFVAMDRIRGAVGWRPFRQKGRTVSPFCRKGHHLNFPKTARLRTCDSISYFAKLPLAFAPLSA